MNKFYLNPVGLKSWGVKEGQYYLIFNPERTKVRYQTYFSVNSDENPKEYKCYDFCRGDTGMVVAKGVEVMTRHLSPSTPLTKEDFL